MIDWLLTCISVGDESVAILILVWTSNKKACSIFDADKRYVSKCSKWPNCGINFWITFEKASNIEWSNIDVKWKFIRISWEFELDIYDVVGQGSIPLIGSARRSLT